MALNAGRAGAAGPHAASYGAAYGDRTGLFSRLDANRDRLRLPDPPGYRQSTYAAGPDAHEKHSGSDGCARTVVLSIFSQYLRPCRLLWRKLAADAAKARIWSGHVAPRPYAQ